MASPAPDPYVGTLFGGRWAIERPLMSGGMGAVYVAKHTDTGRPVALKVIKSGAANQPELVSRFRRETGALAAVSHPNVVTFLDSGVENGNFFLVMELLSGRSLRAAMTSSFEWQRAFRIGADICRALSAIHKLGIVHRDLKPDNVFLQDSEGHDEFAKLIDFGIARLEDNVTGATLATQTGAIVGTPGYIAPEQLQGKTATVASDVYAVGVILYELVTGKFPFASTSVQAMLVKQLIDPLTPPRALLPALPAHVENAILRMMARDPAERVATAKDALALLLETLGGRGDASSAAPHMPLVSLAPTASTETATPRPLLAPEVAQGGASVAGPSHAPSHAPSPRGATSSPRTSTLLAAGGGVVAALAAVAFVAALATGAGEQAARDGEASARALEAMARQHERDMKKMGDDVNAGIRAGALEYEKRRQEIEARVAGAVPPGEAAALAEELAAEARDDALEAANEAAGRAVAHASSKNERDKERGKARDKVRVKEREQLHDDTPNATSVALSPGAMGIIFKRQAGSLQECGGTEPRVVRMKVKPTGEIELDTQPDDAVAACVREQGKKWSASPFDGDAVVGVFPNVDVGTP